MSVASLDLRVTAGTNLVTRLARGPARNWKKISSLIPWHETTYQRSDREKRSQEGASSCAALEYEHTLRRDSISLYRRLPISQKWVELANEHVYYPIRSHDGKYIYFGNVARIDPAIYRVRISDHKQERLAQIRAVHAQLQERIAAVPGVLKMAIAPGLPAEGAGRLHFTIVGQSSEEEVEKQPQTIFMPVTPGYY